MNLLTQITKTLGFEQSRVAASVSADPIIAELNNTDELYFYVDQMQIDGELIDVVAPNIESQEDQRRLRFKIAMPNVIHEAMKIDLSRRVLQVYAEKRHITASANKHYGMYINLPNSVEPESIQYQFENNYLLLSFNKLVRQSL